MLLLLLLLICLQFPITKVSLSYFCFVAKSFYCDAIFFMLTFLMNSPFDSKVYAIHYYCTQVDMLYCIYYVYECVSLSLPILLYRFCLRKSFKLRLYRFSPFHLHIPSSSVRFFYNEQWKFNSLTQFDHTHTHTQILILSYSYTNQPLLPILVRWQFSLVIRFLDIVSAICSVILWNECEKSN